MGDDVKLKNLLQVRSEWSWRERGNMWSGAWICIFLRHRTVEWVDIIKFIKCRDLVCNACRTCTQEETVGSVLRGRMELSHDRTWLIQRRWPLSPETHGWRCGRLQGPCLWEWNSSHILFPIEASYLIWKSRPSCLCYCWSHRDEIIHP